MKLTPSLSQDESPWDKIKNWAGNLGQVQQNNSTRFRAEQQAKVPNNQSEFEKNGGVNDDARLASAIARNAASRASQTPGANDNGMGSPVAALFRQGERDFTNSGSGYNAAQPAQQYQQPNYDPQKYNYNGKSGDQMANDEFGPQFAMLEKMRKDASTNYSNAGNKIGSMYSSLASAIRGDAPAVKQEYANTGQGIGSAYNEAIDSTKQDFQDSRGDVAGLAQRLGQEGSVPTALIDNTSQEGNLVGLLNSNKANQTVLNSQLGQNESDYNRSEANISDAAGVNAKSDFAQRLAVALQGMDAQKLALAGQQSTARNKYNFDIQDLIQRGQTSNNNFANDRATLDSNNRFKTADADLQQNRLIETKRSNLANEANRTSSTVDKATSDRAYQTLSQNAAMEYGGNQESADQARKIVEDAFNKSGGGGSLNGFLDNIQNNYSDVQSDTLGPKFRDRGDQQTILRLAALFYNQINGK